MPSELRLGITGSGFMGRTFAAVAREIPEVRLVAVAEGTRAPALAHDFGIDCEPSAMDLARRPDIDLIVVTTPQQLHARDALLAFEHGKHVFCEKPMATTVADCDRMIEAAARRRLLLGVGYHQRQRAANKAAHQLVRSGSLGRVLSMQVFQMFQKSRMVASGLGSTWSWWDQPESVGHILAGGVHGIDMCRWFLGAEVATVFARCDTFVENVPTENHTMALFTMTDGTVVSLWATSVCPAPVFPGTNARFLIMGDRRILDHNPYGKVQLGDESGWKTVSEQEPINQDQPGAAYRRPRIQAYIDELSNMISAVRGGSKLDATAEDGRAGVEATLAMLESSRRRAEIRLR